MPPIVNNKRKRMMDKPVGGGGKRTKQDAEAAAHDPVQQEASLKAYMFHAHKLVSKACKKAKAAELQKLHKKLKSTKESPESLSSFQLQLSALEPLSPAYLARLVVSLRLSKLAAVRSASFLPSVLASIPRDEEDDDVAVADSSSSFESPLIADGQSPRAKATNRVLANRFVSDAWDQVSRAVRKRMGLTVEPTVAAALPPTAAAVEKGKGKSLTSTAVGDGTTTTVRTTTSNDGDHEGGSLVVGTPSSSSTLPAVEPAGTDQPVQGGGTGGGGEKRLSKRAQRKLKADEVKKNLPKRSMEMSAERKAALEALARHAGDDDGDDDEDAYGQGSEDDEGPVAGSEDEELDDDEIERELAAMNEGLGSEGEWSGSEDEDQDGDEDDDNTRPSKRTRLAASPSPPPTATGATKKERKVREIPTHKPVTSSAFLPTLASGYVSYSDSDGEDAKWVKAAERENKKGERKNRRGQRARQAIWEKKYGSAAAHVVKATGGKPVPLEKLKKHKKAIKSGVEPVPKTSTAGTGTADEKPFDPAHAPGGSANPNAQPIAPRKGGGGYGGSTTTTTTTTTTTGSGEKMHPSWEAKRKQAEALKATQPQGKKITFD